MADFFLRIVRLKNSSIFIGVTYSQYRPSDSGDS